MQVRASALRREETGETHVSQRQLGKRTGALCLGIGRLGIAKMSVLPKMNCQFNTTPKKKSDKLILKFIWNCKRLRNSTNYIENENKIRFILTSKFKIKYGINIML